MAAAREYELVLMLDPGQDAPARDALANDARGQIEASGTLKHENNWGLRKMAYEIEQRNEADYRWFRFEAPADLLLSLEHSLKIADGVLRFRIFRVDPDAPVMVPPATAAPGPATGRDRDRGDGPPRGPSAPPQQAAPAAVAEPATEAPGETATEAPAAPATEAPAPPATEAPAAPATEPPADPATEAPAETATEAVEAEAAEPAADAADAPSEPAE